MSAPMAEVHEDLLLWCSELGQGQLRLFRETYEWLAGRGGPSLSWGTVVANLQVLGHIEADWTHGTWAAAPTVLTTMSNAGGFALLVGARPRWLMERLEALDQDPDPGVRQLSASVILQPAVSQPGGPSARFVAVEDETVARQLCQSLGIHYGHWVADELATILPSLDAMLRARPTLLGPAGVEPRRMSPHGDGPMWQECDHDGVDGAYEYKRYGVPQYVFRQGGQRFMADKRTVVYAELARAARWVLRFDRAHRELIVPARMQLPLPQGRCAVLRSGLLPRPVPEARMSSNKFLRACLRHVNIDEDLARAIARSLGQQLQLI